MMQAQGKVAAAYPRLITKVGDAWLHGVLYASVSVGLNVGAVRVPDCAAFQKGFSTFHNIFSAPAAWRGEPGKCKDTHIPTLVLTHAASTYAKTTPALTPIPSFVTLSPKNLI